MRPWFAVALCLLAGAAGAQATYRWIDKEGKVHYTDLPPTPAEAARVDQKRLQPLGGEKDLPFLVRKAMADYPVTLFTSPDCGDPCKMGKDQLTKRGIPFSERSVATPADMAALRAASGEEKPGVPVLQVGTQVLKGHQTGEWDNLLDAAGYPKASAKINP